MSNRTAQQSLRDLMTRPTEPPMVVLTSWHLWRRAAKAIPPPPELLHAISQRLKAQHLSAAPRQLEILAQAALDTAVGHSRHRKSRLRRDRGRVLAILERYGFDASSVEAVRGVFSALEQSIDQEPARKAGRPRKEILRRAIVELHDECHLNDWRKIARRLAAIGLLPGLDIGRASIRARDLYRKK